MIERKVAQYFNVELDDVEVDDYDDDIANPLDPEYITKKQLTKYNIISILNFLSSLPSYMEQDEVPIDLFDILPF